jgi:5-methylcytosine-specific restriction endonuclease McrA
MSTKNHYTKEVLYQICAESYSYRQCLFKMNLVPAGGNYACLKKHIELYNIDISHFTSQGWNKGKTIGPKRSIEDYLSNKHRIQSWKLKNRLIKENVLEHKCNNCSKKTWLNKPIPIELHHKDGNSLNNKLSNLELLCPNCHALTDNYRAKNK